MISVGDILKFVVSWLIDDSDLVQQVWHYYVDSGPGEEEETTLDDIVDYHTASWETALDANMPDNLLGTLAELYVWNPGSQQFDGVAQTAHGMDGVNTIDMTAQGVAGLVKFYTSVGRYQGRKYVGPLGRTAIAGDGILTTAIQTALGVWGVLMAEELRTTDMSLLPGTFNRNNYTFHEFTGNVAVAAPPAYQRRRREGTGA